jgi:hypothetical protein
MRVKAVDKVFHDGRRIWLDAKREPSETKPLRMIHRIAEMLTDAEEERPDKLPTTKVMNTKQARVGSNRACMILDGRVKWTPWAATRYECDVLDGARAYAESN